MVLTGPKRHTQKTGDISEQAAITRLLQCGYGVLQPVGQMHRYALLLKMLKGSSGKYNVRLVGKMKINLSLCLLLPVARITR
jgi:hypothetical protein